MGSNAITLTHAQAEALRKIRAGEVGRQPFTAIYRDRDNHAVNWRTIANLLNRGLVTIDAQPDGSARVRCS